MSDPLDNFLRGFAQLMASSAEKRSRGESATQAISRRAFPSPAARLDAWLELHRVGRETTGLDRRVALQSWFLAYDARVADQRFQVAALWDATKLDDVLAEAGYNVSARPPRRSPPKEAAFLVDRADLSAFAWAALCGYLADDYGCLAYEVPPECARPPAAPRSVLL